MSDLVVLPQLQTFCQHISASVRKSDFLTYFQKLSLISNQDGVITLGVVSDFIRDNMSYRFSLQLLECAKKVWEETREVQIIVDQTIDNPSSTQVIDCKKMKSIQSTTEKNARNQTTQMRGREEFASRYDLSHFVVGSSNQLAYSACEAVIRKPATNYNPLFIYSDVGLGKTHLLQGTALEIKKKFKDKKIVYITSDQFVTEFVNSIKDKKIEQMRARFRTIDVLLVDDIQFLAGKKATQEELYNLFNILYDAGKQIILSSDRPPKELTEIEPRLVSRFEWGIMVDIDAPDFETRLAILQQKAREKEFIIPQEVAEYVAYNMGKNIRELEGILNQMIAEYELDGRLPTIMSITSRMTRLGIKHHTIGGADSSARHALKNLTPDDILQAVSQYYGVELEAMLGDNRSHDLMIPRQVSMYLIKNKLHYTYGRVGNLFNGREHSAVMYNCNKLEILLKKDQQVKTDMCTLREKLGV